jgi:arylsulfatase A-like enzyme
VALYDEERAVAGWREERIDLRGHDLRGARLDFVKRHESGSPAYFFAGVWGEPILLPKNPPRRPSVILISIDTLRPDRLGAHGGAPAKTPALDAFAADALLYAAAYSASTWTVPSHHALLRGVDAATLAPSMPDGEHVSPSAVLPVSLAEVFRDAGYLTAGFTGGGYVAPEFRLADGFDTYLAFASPVRGEPPHCPPERFDGPHVFRQARRWVRAHREVPFFLFVHTYDVHDRCLVSPPGGGWARVDPGPDGRRKIIDHYDALVARADDLFASLWRDLDAAGIADEAFVVVTSDHGEGFWEHGFAGHGCALKPHEELIRVPLIVRAPAGGTRGRVEQPVGAAGVAPTLVRLVGLPVPQSMMAPMLPGLGVDGGADAKPVVVHCGEWLAVRDGRHKLISSTAAGGLDAVYDLERDPEERTNLIGADEAAARRLRGLAANYREGAPRPDAATRQAAPAVGDTTRERLRALGYLE